MGRQEALKKAVGNGTIGLIDQQMLGTVLGTAVDAILRQINSEGQRLNLRIDRGEAYTHAAASVLSCPSATNDYTAVRRLLQDDENVPRPVLRFWDFVAFAHQIGQLDEASCDKVRKTLIGIGEWIPNCFSGRNFSDGLPEFYLRLVDGVAPLIGAHTKHSAFDDRQVIFRQDV